VVQVRCVVRNEDANVAYNYGAVDVYSRPTTFILKAGREVDYFFPHPHADAGEVEQAAQRGRAAIVHIGGTMIYNRARDLFRASQRVHVSAKCKQSWNSSDVHVMPSCSENYCSLPPLAHQPSPSFSAAFFSK
jgi:hypothetical protein